MTGRMDTVAEAGLSFLMAIVADCGGELFLVREIAHSLQVGVTTDARDLDLPMQRALKRLQIDKNGLPGRTSKRSILVTGHTIGVRGRGRLG
jgi:hypothetical protein